MYHPTHSAPVKDGLAVLVVGWGGGGGKKKQLS